MGRGVCCFNTRIEVFGHFKHQSFSETRRCQFRHYGILDVGRQVFKDISIDRGFHCMRFGQEVDRCIP